jgi:hypothetical protein
MKVLFWSIKQCNCLELDRLQILWYKHQGRFPRILAMYVPNWTKTTIQRSATKRQIMLEFPNTKETQITAIHMRLYTHRRLSPFCMARTLGPISFASSDFVSHKIHDDEMVCLPLSRSIVCHCVRLL